MKKHVRFAAACLVATLALSPVMASMPALTTNVMAATTKPGKVVITSASKSVTTKGKNQVTLKWNPVSGATEYRIYYRVKGTTDWTRVKIVDINKLTGSHTASSSLPINNGVTYEYSVRGFNKLEALWGAHSNPVEIRFENTAVKPGDVRIQSIKKSVTSTGRHRVTLTWNKAANATEYYLYYKRKGAADWKQIKVLDANTTSTKHTGSTKFPIKTGVTYLYTVRAYNGISQQWGTYDTTGKEVLFTAESSEPTETKIKSISVSPKNSTLTGVGKTVQLEATVSPTTASNKKLSWKSYNTAVATVDGNGKVISTGTGTAVIAALATDGSGVYGSSTITVKSAPVIEVESLDFNNTHHALGGIHGLSSEGAFKLGVTVYPSNATDKSLRWSSTNPSVATVDDDGNVTMKADGETRIDVYANGGNAWIGYDLTVYDERIEAQRVFEFTNKERIKGGREPLKYSPIMEKSAMVRAKEIVVKFSHTRPDGRTAGTALGDLGGTENIGENICGDLTAEGAVKRWMNSPGHKIAMMSSAHKYIGVGVYVTGGDVFYVQQFSDIDPDLKVTVFLDNNGGTGQTSMTFLNGRMVSQSDLPVPTRPGYTFKGWTFYNRPFQSAAVSEGMTFTATWEPAA